MKTWSLVAGVLILTGSAAMALWFPSRSEVERYGPVPTPLTAPEAYVFASGVLGAATNQFFCIWTNEATSFANKGDWVFVFSSTNQHTKTVCVLVNYSRDRTNEKTEPRAHIHVYDDLQKEASEP
jgi:hypothetical protein